VYFFKKDYISKLSISDSNKKEEEILKIEENVFTFKTWNEELKKIEVDSRISKVGVFDFETTHLNGRAVSMSIVLLNLETLKIEKEYYWEFRNPIKMDPESVEIHGLTEEYLQDKPEFIDIYNSEIKSVIDYCDILIAHNSSYDVSVLGRELYENNVLPSYKLRVIDSIPMLKLEMKEKKYNLSFCADFFKVDTKVLTEGINGDFHNALYDCRVLTEVIKKAIEYKG